MNSVIFFIYDQVTGAIERINVSSSGDQAVYNYKDGSVDFSISADGRYMSFVSEAQNLTSTDPSTYDLPAIYLRDQVNGTTRLISTTRSHQSFISANGRFIAGRGLYGDLIRYDTQTGESLPICLNYSGFQGRCTNVSLSADGRFAVFIAYSYGMVPYMNADIYIRDIENGINRAIDISSSGDIANSFPSNAVLSEDGRHVAFSSAANNLVDNDTNNIDDIFVHHIDTGVTERVNLSSTGEQSNGGIRYLPSIKRISHSISADGRFVAFSSFASNLVDNDTNNVADVFVRDLLTKRTARVSLSVYGKQVYQDSYNPWISADGRFISFDSVAPYLVRNDKNQSADTFITENPLVDDVFEVVGAPLVDQNSESGVYIWQDRSGRTFLKAAAGGEPDGNRSVEFSGKIISEQSITSVIPNSIEYQYSDILDYDNTEFIGFDLFVKKPYKDDFSYLADTSKSQCIFLDKYKGGLFIGPNKIRVDPPYDINQQSTCGISTVPLQGNPVINQATEKGVFLWKNDLNEWQAKVVNGGNTEVAFVVMDVESTQLLEQFQPISLEYNDVVNQSASSVHLELKVRSPWFDGMTFSAAPQSDTCVSLKTPNMGIYIGPLKFGVGNNVNLDTLLSCL